MPIKPTPPHLRVLNGNPGKRGVAKEIREQVKATLAAGTATAKVGAAPVWMSVGAKATWRRIVKERGIVWLDTRDRELLAAFCTAYDRMVQSEKAIQKKGTTYETVNGGIGTRPEVRASAAAAGLVARIGAELGLTPSSRARLGTGGGKKKTASDLPEELKPQSATNGTAQRSSGD